MILNCHDPEGGDQYEAERCLRRAFICRRNSSREWEKCGEVCCQEIKGFLDHSQNCPMRVLGGCDTCIQYKSTLLYHASRCRLPLGKCVVLKCDDIREYAKKSSIPENKNWEWKLDRLFFNPPTTPLQSIAPEEQGEVIWPLNQRKLSVGKDGTYLEGIHWMNNIFIGGGSCGRCFLCTDLHNDLVFAIKMIPVQMFDSTEIETWGSISGLYGAIKYHCEQTVIIFMDYMIAYEEAEQYSDDDNSLSSYMSGATESLVSGLSVDPLSSDSAAGQWTNDLGNVLSNDDNNVDDDYDDDDNDDDDEGVHGAEAAIWNFGEGPWQGLPDHDLFVSLPGEDLERLALENADVNDNDMNQIVNNGEFNFDQFIDQIFDDDDIAGRL
ncbi:hypothetical protein OS493_016081 [Desmophyllum pertusum]|uniref:TAZ-type domain-containing protein n=1 Tax=Desmophyllum pertusum TaxID=174260 RepID=A0A9X0A2J7_9CNID|nr:hypothetical protein OS493_016081 [Desmophyllum pertusum]